MLFQELDSNVAVGPDVRFGQVFRPLQKSVVEWDQSVKIVGFAAKFTVEFGFFHCKSNDFVLQLKEINLLNRWPDEDNYDWKHETVYTKSGTELCNWLIHSYCFFFAYNEDMEINSFFISSDYDRNKVLYCVELKDWLSYMEFVGKDYVKSARMESGDKEVDYVYTRKERGSLH